MISCSTQATPKSFKSANLDKLKINDSPNLDLIWFNYIIPFHQMGLQAPAPLAAEWVDHVEHPNCFATGANQEGLCSWENRHDGPGTMGLYHRVMHRNSENTPGIIDVFLFPFYFWMQRITWLSIHVYTQFYDSEKLVKGICTNCFEISNHSRVTGTSARISVLYLLESKMVCDSDSRPFVQVFEGSLFVSKASIKGFFLR